MAAIGKQGSLITFNKVNEEEDFDESYNKAKTWKISRTWSKSIKKSSEDRIERTIALGKGFWESC